MKKTLLFVSGLLLSGFVSIGQTTATDFTANDCAGTAHHLFDELNAGKIIVVSFVMPCHSCVAPSLSAKSAVGSYATSNPGRVLFYLADDDAVESCSTLSSWASANGMGTPSGPIFSTGSFIQSQYGAAGMPKIVAIAGSDHKVIYTENNALNATALKTAINTALANTTGVIQPINEVTGLNVSQDPATNSLLVNYTLGTASFVTIDIYSVTGIKVMSVMAKEQSTGKNETNISLANGLSNGIYLLKLNAAGTTQTVKFNVLN